MKILIIEDEIQLSDAIEQSLKKQLYVTESASNFKEALHKVISYDYDCILLDIMLPDGNGIELLKQLKDIKKDDSVIIISAKDSLDDKVLGLELGADDYLTKPFHLSELHARIKSVLRRRNQNGSNSIVLDNLELFPDDYKVTIDGKEIEVNNKEFALLHYLVINQNRLLTKVAIAEKIWGDYMDEVDSYDFVYSQIKNLRKKLKQNNAQPEIKSVYGMGYKLVNSN
ncbi:response regulator transcription factor [Myroides pelagicus]|uniref:Response regulator n=1 Tax=Myroides pelagicus TaxID=270914 RepID=A0A7K1GKJ4_9FLAO|nr:response regulator transcription factor [Myroides pelagicus]MEC4113461.1 response regulator transcription factor [Myroides pelagicus]MTH29260.1 response regulator [Myroides pelagicus]